MLQPVRRIITGHDENGKSIVIEDTTSPHVLENPTQEGRGLTDLWRTFSAPADNKSQSDAADTLVTLLPPPNGSVFRFSKSVPGLGMRIFQTRSGIVVTPRILQRWALAALMTKNQTRLECTRQTLSITSFFFLAKLP